LNEPKPLLIVVAGPMGAGKTTFYDVHLKEALPSKAVPREHRSFAVVDLIVDTELLESARNAGYATKVIFISTEDPNLNVGRILIRMSHGDSPSH
jgi:predicted ABC-type ATPase